jgi:hypothetical protein
MLTPKTTISEGRINFSNTSPKKNCFEKIPGTCKSLFLVFTGAGLGSLSRYFLIELIQVFWKINAFDMPIFFINFLSCILIVCFMVFLNPVKWVNLRVKFYVVIILGFSYYRFLRRVEHLFFIHTSIVFLLLWLLPELIGQRLVLLRFSLSSGVQYHVHINSYFIKKTF